MVFNVINIEVVLAKIFFDNFLVNKKKILKRLKKKYKVKIARHYKNGNITRN